MQITINPYDKRGINEAIKRLKQYKDLMARKEAEMLNRVTMLGASVASLGFRRAIYSTKFDEPN